MRRHRVHYFCRSYRAGNFYYIYFSTALWHHTAIWGLVPFHPSSGLSKIKNYISGEGIDEYESGCIDLHGAEIKSGDLHSNIYIITAGIKSAQRKHALLSGTALPTAWNLAKQRLIASSSFFGTRLLIITKNHPFARKIGSCSRDFLFTSCKPSYNTCSVAEY